MKVSRLHAVFLSSSLLISNLSSAQYREEDNKRHEEEKSVSITHKKSAQIYLLPLALAGAALAGLALILRSKTITINDLKETNQDLDAQVADMKEIIQNFHTQTGDMKARIQELESSLRAWTQEGENIENIFQSALATAQSSEVRDVLQLIESHKSVSKKMETLMGRYSLAEIENRSLKKTSIFLEDRIAVLSRLYHDVSHMGATALNILTSVAKGQNIRDLLDSRPDIGLSLQQIWSNFDEELNIDKPKSKFFWLFKSGWRKSEPGYGYLSKKVLCEKISELEAVVKNPAFSDDIHNEATRLASTLSQEGEAIDQIEKDYEAAKIPYSENLNDFNPWAEKIINLSLRAREVMENLNQFDDAQFNFLTDAYSSLSN